MLPIRSRGGQELTRWDPFRDLRRAYDDLDRFFTPLFEGETAGEEQAAWWPALDLVDHKDEYVARMDLPGVKKDDIKISVQDNVLTIQGERKKIQEEKEDHYYRLESRTGSFLRRVALPSKAKADGTRADFKDGVLTVRVPKSDDAKPREIRIEPK